MERFKHSKQATYNDEVGLYTYLLQSFTSLLLFHLSIALPYLYLKHRQFMLFMIAFALPPFPPISNWAPRSLLAICFRGPCETDVYMCVISSTVFKNLFDDIWMISQLALCKSLIQVRPLEQAKGICQGKLNFCTSCLLFEIQPRTRKDTPRCKR